MRHAADLLARPLFAFALALSPVSVAAAEAVDTSAALDAIFATIEADAPGCNVGVIRNGDWIHKAGYGMANMELGVALDGSQVHRMGSVSKQFTALAVLLLAEEGRIDLQADIRDYLPALRDYGTSVTVNAMLGHIAGMGDYDLIAGSYEGPIAENAVDLRSAAGGPFRLGNEDYLTIAEFYDVVKRVPLAQEPGQSFRYSNLAYFLLSMLVEDVSGETLREYAARRIFAPLGMRHTFFSDDPVEIVRNRASGYKALEDGHYVTDMTNLFWVGDGGLHTNLDDMLLWDRSFYAPRVGDHPMQLLARMNTPNSQHDARDALYANGQFVGEKHGQRGFWHSGGWLGTSTYYGRFPDVRTSLVMMCNDVSLDTGALAEQALAIILGGRGED
jgi:CubicO group peptidase (beta-lactamase class C family)